jgi:hypothetical protein
MVLEETKIDYERIRFCAGQARHDNLQYFRVDTCYVSKSNNNELSTAINYMFAGAKMPLIATYTRQIS